MKLQFFFFLLCCNVIQAQSHGSFNRRIEKEHIVNIGAQFASAPIFVNRTFIYSDTLYLNLGATTSNEENVNLNVLILNLVSGDSRIENYTISDSLKADKRSFPGSIRVSKNRLYLQEGRRILVFDRQDKTCLKAISIEKGFNLNFVIDDSVLVLFDCFFSEDQKPLKIQLVDTESGLKRDGSFSLAHQELTFMGFPKLLAVDTTKYYVCDIGAPKLRVLDTSLVEIGTFSIPTKYWFDLKLDKKLMKLKEKDPLEYGRIIALEHVSRISNVVLINKDSLLIAIVHPNETFENVCLSTKDFSCLFSDTISTAGLRERISSIDINDFRPWDTFAFGYVDPNYLLSISPCEGNYRFEELGKRKVISSENDYFLSFKIFN